MGTYSAQKIFTPKISFLWLRKSIPKYNAAPQQRSVAQKPIWTGLADFRIF
jgi:hypothetical protein